jgi:hypothetical protein
LSSNPAFPSQSTPTPMPAAPAPHFPPSQLSSQPSDNNFPYPTPSHQTTQSTLMSMTPALVTRETVKNLPVPIPPASCETSFQSPFQPSDNGSPYCRSPNRTTQIAPSLRLGSQPSNNRFPRYPLNQMMQRTATSTSPATSSHETVQNSRISFQSPSQPSNNAAPYYHSPNQTSRTAPSLQFGSQPSNNRFLQYPPNQTLQSTVTSIPPETASREATRIASTPMLPSTSVPSLPLDSESFRQQFPS